MGTVPSQKRIQRICRVISDETGRDTVWQDSKTIVEKLNPVEQETEPSQTRLSGEAKAKSTNHRETTVTAPVLDSTCCCVIAILQN